MMYCVISHCLSWMTHAARQNLSQIKAHVKPLFSHNTCHPRSVLFQVCVIPETDYRPYVEERFSAPCGWSLTHVPAGSPGDRVSVYWERLLSCLRPPWLSCVKNAAYGSSGVKSLPGTWAKMTHWVQLCLHHGNMGVDQRSSFFYSHISPPCSNRRHSVSCVYERVRKVKTTGLLFMTLKHVFIIKTRQVCVKNSFRAVQKALIFHVRITSSYLTVIGKFRVTHGDVLVCCCSWLFFSGQSYLVSKLLLLNLQEKRNAEAEKHTVSEDHRPDGRRQLVKGIDHLKNVCHYLLSLMSVQTCMTLYTFVEFKWRNSEEFYWTFFSMQLQWRGI